MSSLPSLLMSKTAAAMNSESALMTWRRKAMSSPRHQGVVRAKVSSVKTVPQTTKRGQAAVGATMVAISWWSFGELALIVGAGGGRCKQKPREKVWRQFGLSSTIQEYD